MCQMGSTDFCFKYYELSLCTEGPMAKPGSLSKGSMIAGFKLNMDIAPLFPFINAVANKVELYQDPLMVRFTFDQRLCVLYPENGLATPFNDHSEAVNFTNRLMAFLNDIYSRLDEIVPKQRTFRRVSVVEILKLLPKTNCRECGFASCMAFAATLRQQETIPEMCPYLKPPVTEQAVYPIYDSNGNLQSTVTLDIDTTNVKRELQHQREQVDRLKGKIADLLQPFGFNKQIANSSLPMPLTTRELEVLRLIGSGATNIEISNILNISPHTVKSHVIHIFNKLGVDDRTQAAVWATRQNLV
jgi:DNA-binding CsgD family transcriptional regulator/ArsR family metal-binding transcriptional regulator